MEELTGISISDIKRAINNDFAELFSGVPDQYEIYGKTVNEWKEYFTYFKINPDDPADIRRGLMDAANKYEECSDIISELKMAVNKLDLDIFLTNHKTKERGYYLKKKFTDIDRASSMNTFRMNAIKKLASIFIKPFDDYLKKLEKRGSALKAMLPSIANQMNNLNYTSLEE